MSRDGSDDGTLQPALRRAVLGRGIDRRGLPGTMPGMVAFLKRRYGTKPPPGLKEHTWRRLRKDPARSSASSTQAAVRKAFDALRLTESRERRLRDPLHVNVRFKGVITISDDTRYRDLDLSSWYLNESELVGDVLEAFQAGDPDGMDDAFAEALENEIGAAIHFTDIDSIMFD